MITRLIWTVGLLFITQSAESAAWNATTDFPAFYDMRGFEWMSRLEVFRQFDGDAKSHSFDFDRTSFRVEWKAKPPAVLVTRASDKAVWNVGLSSLFERARKHLAQKPGPVPQGQLSQGELDHGARVLVLVEDVSVDALGEVIHLKATVSYGKTKR